MKYSESSLLKILLEILFFCIVIAGILLLSLDKIICIIIGFFIGVCLSSSDNQEAVDEQVCNFDWF